MAITDNEKFLNYLTISELEPSDIAKSAHRSSPKRFIFQSTIGSPITNRQRFFDAANYSLPLDPPNVFHVWDALADSLFGGVVGLHSPSIEIMWPFADQIAVGFLVEGIKFFKQVADSLSTYDDGINGKPIRLRLFLVCANEKNRGNLAAQLWSLE